MTVTTPNSLVAKLAAKLKGTKKTRITDPQNDLLNSLRTTRRRTSLEQPLLASVSDPHPFYADPDPT
jgi:hypothetical protein